MRALAVLVAVLLVLAPAAARAELCAKCQQMSFTADVGTCQECKKQATSSGSHQLCGECSKKLGQCEHCRATLATSPSAAPSASPSASPSR